MPLGEKATPELVHEDVDGHHPFVLPFLGPLSIDFEEFASSWSAGNVSEAKRDSGPVDDALARLEGTIRHHAVDVASRTVAIVEHDVVAAALSPADSHEEATSLEAPISHEIATPLTLLRQTAPSNAGDWIGRVRL